jgi:TAP-like protein
VTLASDQRYPHQIAPFLEAGRHSASLFHDAYLQSGYGEIAMGQLPFRADDAFRGPFRNAAGATPALVIGTTQDPWAPFPWAHRLVDDLGNARLLTFRGDGHDTLTSFDPCIVGSIFAYLEELRLPAPGTVCRRSPPFSS